MHTITDLDKRVRNVYDILNRLTSAQAKRWFSLGKWGVTDRRSNMIMLEDMSILSLWMVMMEWKAWEQNTFFLEFDDNNCPIWQYPSTVVDEETLKCVVKYFVCHCVDVRNMLRKWGLYPYGIKPDGIDYMHIEEGYAPCDDKRFQIDKPYGTDFVP